MDESTGLIIASPEYAHGISGPLKNVLDWLVSSVGFPHKPVIDLIVLSNVIAERPEILST